MNMEQFFYVLEIAETGSFSQAARNLFVTQPNLSYSIKKLEQEVGFQLFERTPSGVILTQEGRELAAHFRSIRNEYDQVRSIVENPAQHVRISLKVGTLELNRMTNIFSELIQKYMRSPIDFSFSNYTSFDALIEEIAASRLDFAVVGSLSSNLKKRRILLANSGIEYYSISDYPICALVGPENPLYALKNPIQKKDLYQFALIQNGGASVDLSQSIPHVLGLSGRTFGEVDVSDSMLFYRTILHTQCVGLFAYVPNSFLQSGLAEKLHVLPIADCGITANFGWIKLRRLPLSDVAADLLQQLTHVFG